MSDDDVQEAELETARSLRHALGDADTQTDTAVSAAIARAAELAVADGAADVAVTTHDTPIGPVSLGATTTGLVALGFGPSTDLMEDLAQRISPRIVSAVAPLDATRRQLDEYFEGRRTVFDLVLDWRLSRGFRLDVLTQLVEVGYGETLSYQELARRAGRPTASRAVGSAMATNPIPIIVPCHRVLRSGGALGGYAGGLDAKRQLLTMEGALLV